MFLTASHCAREQEIEVLRRMIYVENFAQSVLIKEKESIKNEIDILNV